MRRSHTRTAKRSSALVPCQLCVEIPGVRPVTETSLIYNQFLTLSGIPKEAYAYRLGNRSALEWVIDQYQVSTDKRSGINNDPNRARDKQYILRLIGQIITVSLETVKVIRSLPSLGFADAGNKTTP